MMHTFSMSKSTLQQVIVCNITFADNCNEQNASSARFAVAMVEVNSGIFGQQPNFISPNCEGIGYAKIEN